MTHVVASVWLFLLLVVGIEIRQQGCVTFFRFIPWSEIKTYDWKETKRRELISVRLKVLNNMPLAGLVSRAKKDQVDRVLRERLPQGGQVYTASGEPLAESLLSPGRGARVWSREPAERVQAPALLLAGSALMQIVPSAFVSALLAWAARGNKVITFYAILAGVASIVLGVIVAAGALKLWRLRDYRFCRMATILAMLPLGLGFLLGVPGGIWTLLVLKRPSVKAAFARNDSRR
jgi:hypothetical protein